MSCSLENNPTLFPASALGSDDYANVCTVSNITSNSAAQSLLSSCCGSAPVTTWFDGCYSYCNITGSAAQSTWESCFKAGSASNGLDYDCTDGSDPFSPSSWVTLSASAGSTYMGGSSGTLVFPLTTASGAPSSGSATTTSGSPAATGNSTASGSSGSAAAPKSTSSGKASGSATATGSAASASSTNSAAGPTVKQLSKGVVAVVALAFVGLMA
ncbi:hypothetical protein CJF31_00007232 [Rutstroemia sp. NJR-2017a BVV2]|nr:hypothetical protein CJF31_00007232 [Rutstroemia sp. NJR-2017a BVV2]